MQDLIHHNISGIRLAEPGLWTTSHEREISFRTDGHSYLQEVEEASYWFSHRNKCIAFFAAKSHVDWILDIGGGNGLTAAELGKKGITVILLEPSETGVSNARQRGIPYVIRGSLEDCQFRDNSMNNIGMFDVLEHLADDEAVLTKVYQSLKPGGSLFITVPAFTALWSKNDEAAGHFRRYTLKQLNKKLRAAGFRTERSTYLFHFLPPLILLFRKLIYRDSITEKKKFEHAAHNKFIAFLVSIPLHIEYLLLSAGCRFPVGSSCFVIARK